ncbi:cupin domain-containing protein [Pelistega europaea]|uniref:Cupin domain-containing protein n=1 Tax=Pelistega europaea TaxID=106147 RepID=A0A7Y4P718_9BURK|nr:cupin domain-containing protein [Pelistega europaea]NOL50295.1 cupin domain-containing protein [Pelistega europaea]
MQVINIHKCLSNLKEHWHPKLVSMGDFQLRFVKFIGEFEWHCHNHSDKIVYVVSGQMFIDYPNANRVWLNAGDCCVVEKHCEHKPGALKECAIVLIEQSVSV